MTKTIHLIQSFNSRFNQEEERINQFDNRLTEIVQEEGGKKERRKPTGMGSLRETKYALSEF